VNTRRNVARFSALSVASVATTLCLASPASAHATIDPSTTAAGSYTVLTVAIGHGCEESSTTKVAIKIPQQILSVTPTRNPFWDSATTIEELDKPVKDAHGNAVTERVATVEYTAKTPLPHDQRDAFELSLQLPDSAGTTLAFPTVQTCEEGKTAWVEVPSGGASADDLEHPAPTVTITAAEEPGHGDDVDATDTDTEPMAAAKPDRTGLLGLVFGLAGLALGATALVQVRRRK
jgi:periplasmic copper chaperone A